MKKLLTEWRKFLKEEEGGTYYHVTDRETAATIMDEGFWPEWGDIGLGAYFFGTLGAAESYAQKGGWDKSLKDPVILQVQDPAIRPVYDYEISPEWPNPEDYKNIFFWEGDEDSPDDRLVPQSLEIVEQINK